MNIHSSLRWPKCQGALQSKQPRPVRVDVKRMAIPCTPLKRLRSGVLCNAAVDEESAAATAAQISTATPPGQDSVPSTTAEPQSHVPAPVHAPAGVKIAPVVPGTNILSHDTNGLHEEAASKPFMLQLPDLDGIGMTSARSLPALSSAFDLHALRLEPQHNGTFQELVAYIKEYLQQELAGVPPERPVYLLGEGFGAVLAMAVALECRQLVQRLLLVNPSTSYQASPLSRLEPLLANLPPALYAGMPLALAPALIANVDPLVAAAEIAGSSRNQPEQGEVNMGRRILRGAFTAGLGLLRRPPAEVAGDAVKVVTESLKQIQELSTHLPMESLRRRLALLGEGVRFVEPRLSEIEQRALLLLGGRDLVLPSEEEGKRLVKKMQRGFIKVLPDSGHAPLSEASVDVLKLLREEGFLIERRTFTSPPAKSRLRSGASFGAPGPLEIPNVEEVKRFGAEWTASLRNYCSPVFFSTLPDGRIVEGMDGLPTDERPLLFVGNHQLYAFDMNIMVEEVLLQKGLLLRGLAHPTLFGNGNNGSNTDGKDHTKDQKADGKEDESFTPTAMANMYRTFGAVEVSPQNFFRLLQHKEAVLLYPGGVREGFKRKQEKYELFWPQKPEFVRMAARFSTTIIPLSAVGLEDSISLVLDSDEIMRNPLLADRYKEIVSSARPPRVGIAEDPDHDQSFIPPIIAPQVPARLYFLFGQPIRLTMDLYDDKIKCEKVYQEVQGQVEDGIGYLLRRREQDPYKDFFPRYFYENPPLGTKRKAPTFGV